MPTATLPIGHENWQALRVLVRANNEPVTGKALRLSPSRRTKDGTFLDRLVDMGLLEVTGEEPPTEKTARKPKQFRTLYRLTALGLHAAEYGECQQEYGRKG